jgi:hypothetical protein
MSALDVVTGSGKIFVMPQDPFTAEERLRAARAWLAENGLQVEPYGPYLANLLWARDQAVIERVREALSRVGYGTCAAFLGRGRPFR